MSAYILVIGNKNYSSWSLRPWLAMRMAGAAFQEVIIPLRETDTAQRITAHSPAGKVPVLHDGEITVWESAAILEYLAEAIPEARLWPEDREARAVARAVSAEMHAGFAALRTNMPINIRVSKPGRGRTPDVNKDINRMSPSGRTAAPASVKVAHSCSAGSATPMRCTRRWSPASRLRRRTSRRRARLCRCHPGTAADGRVVRGRESRAVVDARERRGLAQPGGAGRIYTARVCAGSGT